ncbi:hypothetical protein [Halomarina ordinaria]|uniref:Uncharacterized protein n=1 Tax=Halomarina ordinaria TaxID=3033939 RepID=A0ABD5UEM1_9EURY|nr:hypothetical protein [Halomarina sp. PSRA2]
MSETERAFLREGEVPAEVRYTAGELEKRVEEKAAHLPEFFEYLLEDIRLYNQRNKLEIAQWGTSWRKLFSIGGDVEVAFRYTAPRASPTGGVIESPSNGIRTGRRFGRMMSRLVPSDGPFDRESVLTEFAWGVLEGVFNHPDEERRAERIHDAARLFTQRAEAERPIYAQTQGDTQRVFGHSFDRRRQRSEVVEQVLRERGVEPEPWVVGRATNLVEQSLGESPYDQQCVWETLDEDEQRQQIREVVVEHRLAERYRLVESLRADIEPLQNKRIRGVTGEEVLSVLFEETELPQNGAPSSEEMSSREIAKRIQPTKAHGLAGSVTSVAEELSGRTNTEPWRSRPLIDKSDEGWKLTAYGKLFAAYHLVDSDSAGITVDPLWHLPEVSIELALEELIEGKEDDD